MTMTPEHDLLIDIARLLRKYGPEAFEKLAMYLQDPKSVESVVQILTTSAQSARSNFPSDTGSKRKSKQTASIKQMLSDLTQSEPEKAQVLSTFYTDLLEKNVLDSLRGIRDFSMDNGLASVTAESREKAISRLLKDLAKRPLEEIRSIVKNVRPNVNRDDRALEGWTDIILNKESKS